MLESQSVPQVAANSVAGLVLAIPAGSIQVILGTETNEVRARIESGEGRNTGRSAVFMALTRTTSAMEIVADVIQSLAEAALAIWPSWYAGLDFSGYRGNTLHLEASRLRLRGLAEQMPEVMTEWANQAVALAHSGRPPRLPDCPPEVELSQLSLALNPEGIIVVVDGFEESAASLVQAVEWIARNAGIAVAVLCPQTNEIEGPFQRIAFGAVTAAVDDDRQGQATPSRETPKLWISPVIGRPHPLSVVEQRVAAALAGDRELAPLFGFNQLVRTTRGSQPCVDLLWEVGKLVVELDGYSDHGTRAAFARDRHRDYELMLSGYTVLRIANDEAVVDIERTVGKIRDMVRLRRAEGGAA